MSNGKSACAQGARENNQLVTPLEKSNKWSLTPFIPAVSGCLFLSLCCVTPTALSEVLYRVGFSGTTACDSPEARPNPIDVCRLYYPDGDSHSISLSGGQGNLTDGPVDGEWPVFGPACVVDLGMYFGKGKSRSGDLYRVRSRYQEERVW